MGDKPKSLAIAFATQRAARKKMAKGGIVGGQAPSETQAKGVSTQDSNQAPSCNIPSHEDKMQRMDTKYQGIADRIRSRRMMAEGGRVDLDSDEGAFADTFDDMNEDMAEGKLYDDSQIEAQPKDSNEKGDKLSDEDDHGKSMFRRIKMKKSQKGDRGAY